MEFKQGPIRGVEVRELSRHTDKRGWLTELFRSDEIDPEFMPAMGYISATEPGITRGPHEHKDQSDLFCFIGPSTFRISLWDNRKDSSTYGHAMIVEAGEAQPRSVLIPIGVVHAYTNIGSIPGWVINLPNRLYAGPGHKQPVDEIRHEDDPKSAFKVAVDHTISDREATGKHEKH